MIYETFSPEETEKIGALLGEHIKKKASPAFVALYGEMGAGKTALVRGIASVLSPGSRVKSPTYTLVNEYRRGSVPLFHFDLCRLSDGAELDSFGFDEYVADGHCVCEWAQILGDELPADAIRVNISVGESSRKIEIVLTKGDSL